MLVNRGCVVLAARQGWRPPEEGCAGVRSRSRSCAGEVAVAIPTGSVGGVSRPVKGGRALESVWRPTVDRAPTLPPDTPCTIHHGISAKTIEGYRRQGKHVVVRHPALLYTAHPKWPKAASDPLDERTAFYRERDVERHMLLWQEAASEKRLDQFEIPCGSSAFHPKYRNHWPQPLH